MARASIPMLLVLLCGAAWASDTADEGLVFSVGAAVYSLQGDFNGEDVLVSPQEIIPVPELVGLAFAPVLKIGWVERVVVVEAFAQGSLFQSYWGSEVYQSSLVKLGLDLDFYPFRGFAVQPYLTVGLAASFFTAREAAFGSGEEDDATFAGTEPRVGAGLSYYLSPRFFVSLEGRYAITFYSEARGVSNDQLNIEDMLHAESFDLGVYFGFML